MSDRTAQQIDDEVRAIIDRNYQRAKEILVANMDKLHLMAESLIKYETIDPIKYRKLCLEKNLLHQKIGVHLNL